MMKQACLPEGKRRSCLAAMGVDLLAPRYILTGAKPSVKIDISPLPSTLIAGPANDSNIENSASATIGPLSTAQILGSVEQKPAHELPRISALVQPSVQQTHQTQSKPDKAVRFQLQFTNNHNGITMVTGLPGSGLLVEHNRFLHALLFAIDRKTPVDLLQEQFKWPLFEGAEKGVAQAKQALAAFLQARVVQQHLGLLIVAGIDAWRYLFDDSNLESNLEPDAVDSQTQHWQANTEKPQSLGGLHERVLLTHDINDLLQQWQLKQDLWQRVQNFI